jgi:hypothetical protein
MRLRQGEEITKNYIDLLIHTAPIEKSKTLKELLS